MGRTERGPFVRQGGAEKKQTNNITSKLQLKRRFRWSWKGERAHTVPILLCGGWVFLSCQFRVFTREKKGSISAHAMLLMKSRAPCRTFILQSKLQLFFCPFTFNFVSPNLAMWMFYLYPATFTQLEGILWNKIAFSETVQLIDSFPMHSLQQLKLLIYQHKRLTPNHLPPHKNPLALPEEQVLFSSTPGCSIFNNHIILNIHADDTLFWFLKDISMRLHPNKIEGTCYTTTG